MHAPQTKARAGVISTAAFSVAQLLTPKGETP